MSSAPVTRNTPRPLASGAPGAAARRRHLEGVGSGVGPDRLHDPQATVAAEENNKKVQTKYCPQGFTTSFMIRQ